jgi:rSAM/selenodomain-associated transferase 2
MISIIVPVLNEAQNLPALVGALRAETVPHEIIVVDGGSDDGSAEIATACGATVIPSLRGRGNQICSGVEHARGDTLFFLHADSQFPAGGLARIAETLAGNPRLVGGNFRLLFDGKTGFSAGLTVFYAFIRSIGLYYGDSGIFVRRSAYDEMGGMRAIPVMEDLDFVRRLERFGKTCCIMEPPLITSSRRFEGRCALKIVAGWVKLHALFWLGVSPERLVEMYRAQVPKRPGAGGRTLRR